MSLALVGITEYAFYLSRLDPDKALIVANSGSLQACGLTFDFGDSSKFFSIKILFKNEHKFCRRIWRFVVAYGIIPFDALLDGIAGPVHITDVGPLHGRRNSSVASAALFDSYLEAPVVCGIAQSELPEGAFV